MTFGMMRRGGSMMAMGGMAMGGMILGAAVLGGAVAGALGLYAAQRLMKRGASPFGHAHQVDGSDATASFDAGIADPNTVPDTIN